MNFPKQLIWPSNWNFSSLSHTPPWSYVDQTVGYTTYYFPTKWSGIPGGSPSKISVETKWSPPCWSCRLSTVSPYSLTLTPRFATTMKCTTICLFCSEVRFVLGPIIPRIMPVSSKKDATKSITLSACTGSTWTTEFLLSIRNIYLRKFSTLPLFKTIPGRDAGV
jgi:hypothetical protein